MKIIKERGRGESNTRREGSEKEENWVAGVRKEKWEAKNMKGRKDRRRKWRKEGRGMGNNKRKGRRKRGREKTDKELEKISEKTKKKKGIKKIRK